MSELKVLALHSTGRDVAAFRRVLSAGDRPASKEHGDRRQGLCDGRRYCEQSESTPSARARLAYLMQVFLIFSVSVSHQRGV
jgi:hypothetical protein